MSEDHQPGGGILRLEAVQRVNLVLLAAVVAGAWLTGAADPWSVAAGGVLMALNVWVMQAAFRRAVRPGGTWRRALAFALLLGKFGLLLGVVGLLFWRYSLDGMGFAAGVTSFLVAAVVVAVRVGQSARGKA